MNRSGIGFDMVPSGACEDPKPDPCPCPCPCPYAIAVKEKGDINKIRLIIILQLQGIMLDNPLSR
jgi:hypothetical protein